MSTINGRACVVNGTPVDKVFSNGRQVYGRNLALGTATPFTMTGSGSKYTYGFMYSLSRTLAKGTTVTISFDITSTNPSGDCRIQFIGSPWQGSGSIPPVSGTQHHSYTILAGANYSDGVQIRLDNSTSTVTVSNFTISESSTEIAWNPAPEDVMQILN